MKTLEPENTDIKNFLPFSSVEFDEEKNRLILLDQTLLPGARKFLSLDQQADIHRAIYLLQVRGAPAIGVAAAFGLYLASLSIQEDNQEDFLRQLQEKAAYLASARPTAVNLSWALNRLIQKAQQSLWTNTQAIQKLLLREAQAIRQEDIEICRRIGEEGLNILQPSMGILTHCNAGQLATIRYGTALAPIYLGQEKGYNFRVYADETRPLLQGARLTAYELQAAGVDTTLICDNMAATVMAKGLIDAVLVGCDRVAANGDTANKIGTSSVAVLANYYGIPFYICAPTSTIDLNCQNAAHIPIEERPSEEITSLWYQKEMAPQGIKTFNPAFDITDHSLITAFITEYGIIKPPFNKNIPKIRAFQSR
ncbi:MAG: S-methyl-5-thioribose-1-phosphate isomerase [Clostridiales bacterium]